MRNDLGQTALDLAIAAALLLAPAISMQFVVRWEAADFAVFVGMLLVGIVTLEGVAAATTSALIRALGGLASRVHSL